MSDQGFAGNAGEWGGPGGNAGGGPTVNAGRCLGCGYNLRGLAMDGRCPECGWSISWSLGGARLHHADGLWRQRVGSGLGWLFLANLLSLIGPTGLGMIGSALPTGVIVAMSLALAVGIYGASIGGAWLATDPEPRRVEDTDRVPRQWARWGFVVGGVIAGGARGVRGLWLWDIHACVCHLGIGGAFAIPQAVFAKRPRATRAVAREGASPRACWL